jgi:hypothetical protein
MSAKSDPSRGMAPPKKPRAIPVALPDNMARLRQIQRDVDTADRDATTAPAATARG